LCRYVKEHPNLLAEGLRVESSDADLGTGDRPDLLLIDEAGGWAVAEVEAAIPTGNHIGMWQSVRYKHMAAAAKGVPCGEVRSFLVAPSIPDDVKHRCEQLGVEPREVVLPES
jgi:RecB family endonuclease NucS